jgi:hypothetical protein
LRSFESISVFPHSNNNRVTSNTITETDNTTIDEINRPRRWLSAYIDTPG